MTKSREKGRSEMREREEKRRGGGKRTTFSTSSLSRLSEFSSSSALPVLASSPWLSQLWTFGTQLIVPRKEGQEDFLLLQQGEWMTWESCPRLRFFSFSFPISNNNFYYFSSRRSSIDTVDMIDLIESKIALFQRFRMFFVNILNQSTRCPIKSTRVQSN